jgi:cytoskeleton protein RodZ
MGEPQYPHTEGTQTSAGQSGSVAAGTNAAPRGVQAAGPASFDSLAAAAARLAQLRESRGWLIDDVSARLKVPASKMRALEAGDISRFPGTTFALGVVRSYAKMLGVDPAPFTQALRREKGEPEPDLSMPASTGTGLPRGRVSVSLGSTQRHRSWWWGVAAVFVALIALALWHRGGEPPAWLTRLRASANGAAASSRGPSTIPVPEQTVASGAAIVGVNVASAVDQDAQPAQSTAADASDPQALSADAASGGAVDVLASQGESAAPPATALAAPAPKASATAAPAAYAATASTPAAAQASSGTEPAQQAAASAGASAAPDTPGTSTVAFTVKQDSWISVQDKSGKQVFSGIVRAGDTKEVAGEQPFKVVAGNRAGVESITLDGKPVSAAKYGAGNGNVSRFSLP